MEKSSLGQVSESSYPYKAVSSHACRVDGGDSFSSSAQRGVATVTGIEQIANEAGLFSYVSNVAPAAVAVDASKWYLYKGQGAVFPASSCSGDINHAVVANGYTNIDGQDVWKIRNSWGSRWGNEGYIYIPMNVNACGVGIAALGVKTPMHKDDNDSSLGDVDESPQMLDLEGYESDCYNLINAYRARVGAPALAWNSAQYTCTNNQAAYDIRMNRAHAGFGQCREYGQNECPGWPNLASIGQCLAMMFAEGPPPAGRFNHYSIMTSRSYKSVVCGSAPAGSRVWMIQNYYF